MVHLDLLILPCEYFLSCKPELLGHDSRHAQDGKVTSQEGTVTQQIQV